MFWTPTMASDFLHFLALYFILYIPNFLNHFCHYSQS